MRTESSENRVEREQSRMGTGSSENRQADETRVERDRQADEHREADETRVGREQSRARTGSSEDRQADENRFERAPVAERVADLEREGEHAPLGHVPQPAQELRPAARALAVRMMMIMLGWCCRC